METFVVCKYENFHKSEVEAFDDYAKAKAKVEELVRLHRTIYGKNNSISRVENTASKCLYKAEIEEMTAEAGIVVDIYCVERNKNEL